MSTSTTETNILHPFTSSPFTQRVGGVELKVKYGQTAYNSIRVCNTDYNWTYVGVTHE